MQITIHAVVSKVRWFLLCCDQCIIIALELIIEFYIGTHNGLKNNAVGVSRQDSLLVYTKKAIDLDIMNFKKQFANAASAREKTYLFGEAWMKGLCGRAALVTFNMIQHSENYVSQLRELIAGLPVFDVICKEEVHDQEMFLSENPHENGDDVEPEKKNDSYDFKLPKSHPKFRHTWSVMITTNVEGEYILCCNCSMYVTCGYVCTHCIHVYKHHIEEHEVFRKFSWHQYSPRLWKISEYLIKKPPKEHTKAEKEILMQILELADDDSKIGIQMELQSGKNPASVLKCKWRRGLCKGTSITETDTIQDPFEVRVLPPKERIKNWDVSMITETEDNSGMVPVYRFEDNAIGIEENKLQDAKMAKAARAQETNKKEVLNLLYDICDKVHFAEEKDYFGRLLGSLEDFHSEAISIVLRGAPNDNSANVNRSFAATTSSPRKRQTFHVFNTPVKKRKSVKKSKRSPKAINMTSP